MNQQANTSAQVMDDYAQYVQTTYGRTPKVFVRGEGAYLWDAEGKRYLDWALEDPAGKGVESVRPIRDEIEGRIRTLLSELLPAR